MASEEGHGRRALSNEGEAVSEAGREGGRARFPPMIHRPAPPDGAGVRLPPPLDGPGRYPTPGYGRGYAAAAAQPLPAAAVASHAQSGPVYSAPPPQSHAYSGTPISNDPPPPYEQPQHGARGPPPSYQQRAQPPPPAYGQETYHSGSPAQAHGVSHYGPPPPSPQAQGSHSSASHPQGPPHAPHLVHLQPGQMHAPMGEHGPHGQVPPPPPPGYNHMPRGSYSGEDPGYSHGCASSSATGPPMAGPPVNTPRQRTSIACKYCRKRKIRCSGYQQTESGKCHNCEKLRHDCVFQPVSSASSATFVPIAQIRGGVPPGTPLYGAYGQPLPPASAGEGPSREPQQQGPPPAYAPRALPPPPSSHGSVPPSPHNVGSAQQFPASGYSAGLPPSPHRPPHRSYPGSGNANGKHNRNGNDNGHALAGQQTTSYPATAAPPGPHQSGPYGAPYPPQPLAYQGSPPSQGFQGPPLANLPQYPSAAYPPPPPRSEYLNNQHHGSPYSQDSHHAGGRYYPVGQAQQPISPQTPGAPPQAYGPFSPRALPHRMNQHGPPGRPYAAVLQSPRFPPVGPIPRERRRARSSEKEGEEKTEESRVAKRRRSDASGVSPTNEPGIVPRTADPPEQPSPLSGHPPTYLMTPTSANGDVRPALTRADRSPTYLEPVPRTLPQTGPAGHAILPPVLPLREVNRAFPEQSRRVPSSQVLHTQRNNPMSLSAMMSSSVDSDMLGRLQTKQDTKRSPQH